MKNNSISKIEKRLPWFIVLAHSFAVIACAIYIGVQYSESGGEVAMLWAIFMIIDFPSGLIAVLISATVESLLRESVGDFATYVFFYAAIFLVFGGLQYFWVTKLLIKWRAKIMRDRAEYKAKWG